MRKFFFILFFICQIAAAQDNYPRNKSADILKYDFSVSINDSTDRIKGKALIKVAFINPADSVSFDLMNRNDEGKGMTVEYVSSDKVNLNWKHKENRLILQFINNVTTGDTVVFSVEYSGIPADGLIISRNKFGKRVFFSDHWPDRAHNYLPCIDHPYDKASVDFSITAPDHYKVIANGTLEEETTLPGGMKLTHWSETVPLATKVMAFGAADFSVGDAGSVYDVPVTTWVYKENAKEGYNDYSVAVKPLKYYSDLIGKYPYEKLANVQSKTIYGGLENAGTIFYSENSVTGQGKAESLVAHEIAHQWFGNCVTENDWYHIWLSEGFATYLTSMYFESTQGKEKLKADMSSTRNRVLKFYDLSKRPVIDTTVTNLMDLLNANSYQKGAWVLHMLRNKIGDDAFFRGLRLFYQRYYNSNALTKDLRKVMEEVSGKDLEKFFYQWLYVAGQPELRIWQERQKRSGIKIFVEQEQEGLFDFDLDLLIRSQNRDQKMTIHVNQKQTVFTIKSKRLVEIIPDPEVKLLFRIIQEKK
jgi:aminopeptidase N